MAEDVNYLDFQAPRGVCRYCGCSNDNACVLDSTTATSITCGWVDSRRTICSADECLAKYRELTRPALEALIAGNCVCGAMKSRKKFLCAMCWRELPWAMSAVLYEEIAHGAACYYAEAVA